MTTATRIIRTPRGTSLTCEGWPQRAALRILVGNLDHGVVERPDDLVVYDGSGKAARNWPAFDAITRGLTALEHDETPLARSGNPLGVFQTHPDAPRGAVHHSGGVSIGHSRRAGIVIVAHGTTDANEGLERVLTCDPGIGVLRHANTGCPEAIAAAERQGVRIPMREEDGC